MKDLLDFYILAFVIIFYIVTVIASLDTISSVLTSKRQNILAWIFLFLFFLDMIATGIKIIYDWTRLRLKPRYPAMSKKFCEYLPQPELRNTYKTSCNEKIISTNMLNTYCYSCGRKIKIVDNEGKRAEGKGSKKKRGERQRGEK